MTRSRTFLVAVLPVGVLGLVFGLAAEELERLRGNAVVYLNSLPMLVPLLASGGFLGVLAMHPPRRMSLALAFASFGLCGAWLACNALDTSGMAGLTPVVLFVTPLTCGVLALLAENLPHRWPSIVVFAVFVELAAVVNGGAAGFFVHPIAGVVLGAFFGGVAGLAFVLPLGITFAFWQRAGAARPGTLLERLLHRGVWVAPAVAAVAGAVLYLDGGGLQALSRMLIWHTAVATLVIVFMADAVDAIRLFRLPRSPARVIDHGIGDLEHTVVDHDIPPYRGVPAVERVVRGDRRRALRLAAVALARDAAAVVATLAMAAWLRFPPALDTLR